jgi:hypothetical protein
MYCRLFSSYYTGWRVLIMLGRGKAKGEGCNKSSVRINGPPQKAYLIPNPVSNPQPSAAQKERLGLGRVKFCFVEGVATSSSRGRGKFELGTLIHVAGAMISFLRKRIIA